MRFLKFVLITCFLLILPASLYADLSLSVQTTRSGGNLDFGKAGRNVEVVQEEAIIRISSDIQSGYRLKQRVISELRNPEGQVIPEGTFQFYCLRGTNRYGTLHILSPQNIEMRDLLLYTSDSSGSSDAFKMVFLLDMRDKVYSPGIYRGRMAFILEPISANVKSVIEFLDVRATIEAGFAAIEVNTESGSKNLVFKSTGTAQDFYITLVNPSGNAQIVVYPQDLSAALRKREALKAEFSLKEGRGKLINQELFLENKPLVLYQSQGTDTAVIRGRLSLDTEGVRPGMYKKLLKFKAEGPYIPDENEDYLSVSFDVPRILDIEIKPQEGFSLVFRDLKPDSPPRENFVSVEVHTNLDTSYQVVHKMLPLANERGEVYPEGLFQYMVSDGENDGVSKIRAFSPIEKEKVIFLNSKGNPDKFIVTYRLSPSPDVKAGNYKTDITFEVISL